MDDRIFGLLEWCQGNNVWIDPRLVIGLEDDINGESCAGITVFSLEPIPDVTTVVRIPKTSILSIRSCKLSDLVIEVASPYLKDEPNIGLSLALLTEIKLGTESRWWAYIQSMPRTTVDIASFWPCSNEQDAVDAIHWLKNTEVEKMIRKEQVEERLRRFYDLVSEPLLRSLGWECTYQEMRHAYSLVSSRAFHVDAYHGVSMVPIADAFNHLEDHQVHLETDYFVCPSCGSLDQCIHDDGSDGRPTPQSATTEEDCCEMVTNLAIEANEEVFNTYDSHLRNAQSLCHYGFALEGNSNDAVTWDLADLKHTLNHSFLPQPTTPDSRLIKKFTFNSNSVHRDIRHSPSLEALVWELFKALPTKDLPIESQLIYDALDHRSVETAGFATLIISSNTTRSNAQSNEGPSSLSHPSQLSSTEHLFSVNADGLISHHLFTYLVACKLFLHFQQSLDNGPSVRSSEGTTVGTPHHAIGTDGLYMDVGPAKMRDDMNTGKTVEKAGHEYVESIAWVLNDKIGFSPDVAAKFSNIWTRLTQDVLPQVDIALESDEDEPMTTTGHVSGSSTGVSEDYDVAVMLLCAVAGDIQKLCDDRVKSIGPSSGEALEWDWGDILDKTPSSQKRTRLAIAHALTERSFLETCGGMWKEVEHWAADT